MAPTAEQGRVGEFRGETETSPPPSAPTGVRRVQDDGRVEVRAFRQAGGPAHSAAVVAPTEPDVEADPFAPTEPNVKAQVLFTTADGVATSGPNTAVDIRATTADPAPIASPIAAVGSVAWPAAPREVQLGPPSLRRVEGPKLGPPAAEAIAPTEANAEAQVSSVKS